MGWLGYNGVIDNWQFAIRDWREPGEKFFTIEEEEVKEGERMRWRSSWRGAKVMWFGKVCM